MGPRKYSNSTITSFGGFSSITETTMATETSANKLTLQYANPFLEKEYVEYYTRHNSKDMKTTYIVAACLYALLSVLYIIMNTDTLDSNAQINVLLFSLLGFVVPTFLVFGFTFTQAYIKNAQIPNALLSVLGCFMLVLSTSTSGNTTDLITVPGTLIILSSMTPFFKLRMFPAIAVCILVVIWYAAVTFVAQTYSTVNKGLLATFVLIGGGIIYSSQAYQAEFLSRKSFLYERQIQKENQRLKRKLDVLRKQDKRNKVDLDAPVEKVLSIVKRIKATNSLNDGDADDLDLVARILSNTQSIWAPNFSKQFKDGNMNLDEDMKNYLFYELAHKEKESAGATSARFQKTDDLVDAAHLASSSGDVTVQSQDESKENKDFTHALSSKNVLALTANEERKLNDLLDEIENWSVFDIFEVNDLTHGRPLFFVSNYLFQRHNLFTKFNIDVEKFRCFLERVEDMYHPENPYHNNIHAADVLMNTNYIITSAGLANYLTEMDVFAALFAAIVHDLDHPGLNNAFQANAETDLAITYNDKAILEMHHVSTAFRLMKEEQYNVLSGMTKDDKKAFRETVITLVLATDMSKHFDIMGQFKSRVSAEHNFETAETADRMLLMQCCMKVADIGHVSKPTELHHRWTSAITEEFWNQGDKEKEMGLPVSPFMDRAQPKISKSQVGFMDFVCMPLFETYCNFLEHTIILDQIMANRDEWVKRASEEEEEQ